MCLFLLYSLLLRPAPCAVSVRQGGSWQETKTTHPDVHLATESFYFPSPCLYRAFEKPSLDTFIGQNSMPLQVLAKEMLAALGETGQGPCKSNQGLVGLAITNHLI